MTEKAEGPFPVNPSASEGPSTQGRATSLPVPRTPAADKEERTTPRVTQPVKEDDGDRDEEDSDEVKRRKIQEKQEKLWPW